MRVKFDAERTIPECKRRQFHHGKHWGITIKESTPVRYQGDSNRRTREHLTLYGGGNAIGDCVSRIESEEV